MLKECFREAKFILRKKIYQEKLLKETEKEFEAFEQAIQNPESIEVQRKALDGLKEVINRVKKLTQLHKNEENGNLVEDEIEEIKEKKSSGIAISNEKIESTKEVITDISDSIWDEIIGTKKSVGTGAESVKNQVVEGVEDMKQTVKQTATGFVSSKKILASNVNQAKDKISESIEDTKDTNDSIWDKIVGTKNKKNVDENQVSAGNEDVKDVFAAGFDNYENLVKSGYQDVEDNFESDLKEKEFVADINESLSPEDEATVLEEISEITEELLSEKVPIVESNLLDKIHTNFDL